MKESLTDNDDDTIYNANDLKMRDKRSSLKADENVFIESN